ncbi:pseudouridine-5'-phosphatase-like isoform X2 [Battus philenor]|uniref:pseudouridine-5'-phosphatase-like isoform X2 n=1 Tax=Battus philenor TaxID=42288 RepID=UPI0035CF17D5
MSFIPVTHVLFDMDGLILDTENLYTIAFQNILSRFGKEFTFDIKLKLMGSQAHECAQILITDLDLPMTVEEFIMETKVQFQMLFPDTGLMPDTEDLYTIGFQKIASRYGKEFTFALKCKIMGQQSREFAASIIDSLELPLTVDEFLEQSRTIFKELFPESKVLPGVAKLIHHLCQKNVPIGLATSSSVETYNLKVQKHTDLFDLFKYKTWGSSDPLVKRGKPYPDIFLVAAAKFPENPVPEKVLVFEDSINGVKAAHAAGMQVVMVPDMRLDRSLVPEATLILDSMENFQPEAFGLPPFE